MKAWEVPQFDCKKPGCGARDSGRCTEPADRLGSLRDLEASKAVGCRAAYYTQLAIEDRESSEATSDR
jgi:hypothetical protein